jgi:hypothetical protein
VRFFSCAKPTNLAVALQLTTNNQDNVPIAIDFKDFKIETVSSMVAIYKSTETLMVRP